jgi:hypothetical protein
MMTPRSSSSGSLRAMWPAARRATLNDEIRLSSSTSRNSWRGWGPSFVSVRLAIPPPAVFTEMCSSPPSASTAASMAASVLASSVTSQGWNVPPREAATSAPADCGRSMMATLAPFSTSCSAEAFAIPDAPPTMIAFLALICMSGSSPYGEVSGWRSPKKNASALSKSQAERTSSGRSSAPASPRQRSIDNTGWSVANMMRSAPRVRM